MMTKPAQQILGRTHGQKAVVQKYLRKSAHHIYVAASATAEATINRRPRVATDAGITKHASIGP